MKDTESVVIDFAALVDAHNANVTADAAMKHELEVIVNRIGWLLKDLELTQKQLQSLKEKFGNIDLMLGGEPEEEESKDSAAPTISFEDYYGQDVYKYGYKLYEVATAIREALGLTWDQVAALIEGSPDYSLDDAYMPFPSDRIRDMKYPPRWYPAANEHGGRWFYPSANVARINYAYDAAQYWVNRLNIDLSDKEEEHA